MLADSAIVITAGYRPKDDVWSSDDGGRSWAELPATPLHWAASHGRADDVARLVAAGDDVDARSHIGLTPLHLACSNDHTATAEALIARGADIRAKDRHGRSPLDCLRVSFRSDAIKDRLVELSRSPHIDMFRSADDPRAAVRRIVELAESHTELARAAIVQAFATPGATTAAMALVRIERGWRSGRTRAAAGRGGEAEASSDSEAWWSSVCESVPAGRRGAASAALFDRGWRSRSVRAAVMRGSSETASRVSAWAARHREEQVWRIEASWSSSLTVAAAVTALMSGVIEAERGVGESSGAAASTAWESVAECAWPSGP